ncbi:MAG TPA: maleylacetoacetate isomerase [Usitatibacter sp.]
MILHDYFRSSAAYRVRIALNLKGLEAERRFVHLRKNEQRAPGFLAVNPQGLVPALVLDDGTALTQSLAIIEYLEERHPSPPLLPQGAEDRAFVRAIALAIACDIHPLNNLRVLRYLESACGVDEPKRNEWYRHWIDEGFAAIEPQLASRASGRYSLGNTPTLADICLVPQVANAGRLKIPMDPYPRIRAINEACLSLPAFDRAQPSMQPDAE